MRRGWLIAIVCASVAATAYAQRSGGRGGGFSGHASPEPSMGVSRDGFSPARSGYSFGPRAGYASSRSFSGVPRGFAPQPGARPNFYNRRSGYGANRGRGYYGRGLGYGLGGWIAPYYLAYPDDFGYDDSYRDPNGSVDQSVGPQVANPGPYADGLAYGERGTLYQPQAASAPRPKQPLAPEDTVTLIFKDGRPPEHIRNYMLTRTTLYVTDQRRQEIAVDALDLAATAKVNHAAGVDFELPAAN